LIPADSENGSSDRSKMMLAADLKWLISEGYLIEFNDGSLDLPRAKPTEAKTAPTEAAEQSAKAGTRTICAETAEIFKPTTAEAPEITSGQKSDSAVANESLPS
jgi:hypothetical protein